MIKIAAALFMLIDHIGMIFFKDLVALRIIGRLAMPLFAYCIAAGFCRTRSFKKYLGRMGLFAIASQIPFWMMQYVSDPFHFDFLHFNIGFTFFYALIVLYLYEQIKNSRRNIKVIYFVCILGVMVLSTVSKCDYGAYAILFVVVFYEFYLIKKDTLTTFLMLFLATAILFIMGRGGQFYIQLFALPAYLMILVVKDKPIKGLKYFFYFFYPLHMVVLSIIKWIQ